MKFAQTMTVLIAGSAVGIAAIQVQPSQAAVLNYDFSVAIDSASSFLPGVQGNGSFSVDDSSFDELGSAVPTQLDFKFNGLSGLYTAKDDIDYPNYPIVFQTTASDRGASVGLNFKFLHKNSIAPAPEEIVITGNAVSLYADAQLGKPIGFGTVSYATAGVPEPSGIGGMLLAGGTGLWLLKRKRSARASRKLNEAG